MVVKLPPDELQWDVFADCGGELKWLNSKLTDAMKGNGRVVFVIGPEDAGKSALLGKFQEQVKSEHRTVLTARVNCKLGEEPVPFQLPDDMIHQLKENLRSPFIKLARKLFRRVVGGVEEVGLQVRGLSFRWRRPPQAAPARNLVDALKRMAKRRTALFMLDDLDFANPQFYPHVLELCRVIQDKQAKIRALLAATFQPADERHQLWKLWKTVVAESDDPDINLDLDELRKEDHWKRRFLDDYLTEVFNSKSSNFDDSFRNGIIRWTQGSPEFCLFAKEALKFCERQGYIRKKKTDGSFHVDSIGRIDPPRLRTLIKNRWENLPEEDKEVLRVAAVEASKTARFTLEVLTKVLTRILDPPPQQIAERLTGKLGSWVIQEERAGRQEPPHCYRFRHSLYREIIYGTLDDIGDKKSKPKLHAQVGLAKQELAKGTGRPEDVERVAEELAEHFRKGKLWPEAESYYRNLQGKWTRQGLKEKLLGGLDGQADALQYQNKDNEADLVLQQLIQVARECDNLTMLLEALTRRAETLFRLGRFAEAAPLMEEVMALHTHAEPSAERYFLFAVSLFASRELERAKAQIEKGKDTQELGTDPGAIADAHSWLDQLLTQDPSLPGVREAILELEELTRTL